MRAPSKLKQILDLFGTIRFHAGAWPIRAFPGMRHDPARAGPRPILAFWWWIGSISAVLLVIAWIEMRTSVIESWLFTTLTSSLTYDVRPGAASVIVFPRDGPVDIERGYPDIPDFVRRLEKRGFRITEQARFSRPLALATRVGFTPPYAERPTAGLVIRGADDEIVYDARPHDRVFGSLDELPRVIENSLLFIEDREVGRPMDIYHNPAVDWERLAKATLQYTASRLGFAMPKEGGSTLAVQMEKYRHSTAGRTEDPLDKLRQLGSASLRAYHSGPDTRSARRRIVLDYLNTVPLAAAPGYGEVHGLKEGIRVWFGREPDQALKAVEREGVTAGKARAYKQVLALLCAVRAPSNYLLRDHPALEARVNGYSHLLAAAGILPEDLAERVRKTPLHFTERRIERPRVSFADRKATDLTRRQLQRFLGAQNLYALDRLDLEVETTIDPDLQKEVEKLFASLHDPEFVEARGLKAERMLATGDPAAVVYSFALFEHTPRGDMVRVHADNLNKPFDVNHGMKMELGSTAKLRTLAHYLEIMAELHTALAGAPKDTLARLSRAGRDPLTGWAAGVLEREPDLAVEPFLERSLEREYSASPSEMFFTGGGVHYFGNFDPDDNGKHLTIREATAHSTNLVFIRLMRDLVRYHTARLPYDVDAMLSGAADSVRIGMLDQVADDEAKLFLARAYRRYHEVPPDQIPARFLEKRAESARHLAVLYFAWNADRDSAAFRRWLATHVRGVTAKEVGRLWRGYSNPRFTLADYAFLLNRQPLEVWCAGELMNHPGSPWDSLVARSRDARRVSMEWLLQTRNKAAQNLRLRVRVERDAFARMEPHWKKLGFPFESLVPSLATAIGSSADRPDALAELMGIIVDDGVRRSPQLVERVRFASGTPYHTVLEAPLESGERVLPVPVARALRGVLAEVVEHGTAQRIRSAFADSRGRPRVIVGGKTGSGDNRLKAIGKNGGVISSRATSRTAAFTFYIGDQYYGVVTASVTGSRAEQYSFTSALPLEVLKMVAPAIMERVAPAGLKPEPLAGLVEPDAEAKTAAAAAQKDDDARARPAEHGDRGATIGPQEKPSADTGETGPGSAGASGPAASGPEPRNGAEGAVGPAAERSTPGDKGESGEVAKKNGKQKSQPEPPLIRIKRTQKPDFIGPASDTTGKARPRKVLVKSVEV